MKVKYLKDHNNAAKGDVADVTDDFGRYLISVGVAKAVTEDNNGEETEKVENITPTSKKQYTGRGKEKKKR